jgi:hypothetical protein
MSQKLKIGLTMCLQLGVSLPPWERENILGGEIEKTTILW